MAVTIVVLVTSGVAMNCSPGHVQFGAKPPRFRSVQVKRINLAAHRDRCYFMTPAAADVIPTTIVCGLLMWDAARGALPQVGASSTSRRTAKRRGLKRS
jgi:hypothetical protein